MMRCGSGHIFQEPLPGNRCPECDELRGRGLWRVLWEVFPSGIWMKLRKRLARSGEGEGEEELASAVDQLPCLGDVHCTVCVNLGSAHSHGGHCADCECGQC